MKNIAHEEQAFRSCEEFDKSVLSYVAAKIRFLVRGLLLSISVMVFSILLHWLWPVSEWNVSGNMAGLGLGGFCFVALSAFYLKRLKCPLCSRKTELRSRFTGFGGDEETIIICRFCKVQCPTGIVSD